MRSLSQRTYNKLRSCDHAKWSPRSIHIPPLVYRSLALDACSSQLTKTYQIILSTAHPVKFSEAVTKALEQNFDFNFEQDVFPKEFRGLLNKERRVVVVERPELTLVKEVIEWL
jgi:hypothetical protein